jgi:hypothetical protein
MEPARGEKNVRSVPRSRWMRSWFFSRVSRISSSDMRSGPGSWPATWRLRHSQSAAGAVV